MCNLSILYNCTKGINRPSFWWINVKGYPKRPDDHCLEVERARDYVNLIWCGLFNFKYPSKGISHPLCGELMRSGIQTTRLALEKVKRTGDHTKIIGCLVNNYYKSNKLITIHVIVIIMILIIVIIISYLLLL